MRKTIQMLFVKILLASTCLCMGTIALPETALAQQQDATSQTITPNGSQPSIKAPTDHFTGVARVDPLFPVTPEIPASAAYVTFAPGARSAWHTHPRGQRLIVTSGLGLTQQWGGPIQEIRPGDVVCCPPDVKHWHGASPTTSMTHIAVTGSLDGKSVVWMEKVTDEQYNAYRKSD